MANEYRATKVAVRVLVQDTTPETRVYGVAVEVWRSVDVTPPVSGGNNKHPVVIT